MCIRDSARNIQREARSRLGVENAESLTPAELLERYLLSKNTPPERAEALLSLARDVFQGQP